MAGTAREALIAEALGEMAALLDRVEAVQPALDAACRELVQAGEQLAGSAADAEARIVAIADSATAKAVQHIARRTNELVRGSADTEIRAMRATARELLRTEFESALARTVQAIDARHRQATKNLFKWCAVTGLLTALVSSLATIFALSL